MPRGVPRVPGAEAQNQPATLAEVIASEEGVDPTKFDTPTDYRKLRAIDVDPTKIRRAVLTLDGWVCPASSPGAKAKE